MAATKAFEFLILEHPTKKEAEGGARSRIVSGPRVVLAADERAAGMIAAREIPAELVDRIDHVEVAVRPF